MASEAVLLRGELVAAHIAIFDRDNQIEVLKGQVASERAEKEKYKARLALYEGPNAPSSTKSQFNHRRNEYRKKHGARGSDGSGSDRPVRPDGKGRKRGPPTGHAGVSHTNVPVLCRKYSVSRCGCGARLERGECIHKTVSDFDKCKKVVTFTAVLETGRCPDCKKRVVAPSPFLEGTSMGPVLLGLITELYGMRCTDAAISHFLESFFGFKVSETAIASARKAVSCALDRQLDLIKRAFLTCNFVQGDETGIKIGIVGRVGTVWVFICKHAAFVVATTHKSIPFLREHFGWLLHLPVVSDRNSSYNAFAGRQCCWRHLLGHVEAPAVDGDAGDRARHEQASGFYHKIKHMKTAAPFTVTELTREVRSMISAYPEGKAKNHLAKAVPDMFTFLSYPGMPPHNNATELAIRDGPVRHRNVRHQITTPEGREIFSRLLTFIMTCGMNHIFPCRAVVEMLRDPGWDMFNPGPPAPRDWSVFDSPASSLPRPPGAEAGRRPAPAAAVA